MEGLSAPRPLAATDDRDSFDCGKESLNAWFRRNGWRNQMSGVSRTTVICVATGVVAGFVSLSAGHIERTHLPKPVQRNRPDPIPVLLLGQLAVDRRYQGKGCAHALMLFALTTAVRVSEDIGCFGVATRPIDDAVRAFYGGFGFQSLPSNPKGSMIVRINDLLESDISYE